MTRQVRYDRIAAEGSPRAATAIDAVRDDLRQFGTTVDDHPSGSNAGRRNLLESSVDFACDRCTAQARRHGSRAPRHTAQAATSTRSGRMRRTA